MKYIHSIIFLLSIVSFLSAQSDFSYFFREDKLRFDYWIRGNRENTKIDSCGLYYDKNWGGSKINTIDTFLYGELLLEVFDSVSNILIYSRGYSSLFKEWQITDEADSLNRKFKESVIMPFPRNTVRIEVSERNFDMSFSRIFSMFFDPRICKIEEKISPADVRVRVVLANGPACSKVDLVFLSEGYLTTDSLKFFRDVRKTSMELFQWDPYHNCKRSFNIYAVFVPSENRFISRGSDTLSETALHTHFNTFGSEQYLTTEDIWKVRDVVSGIPYDQLCIIVNTDKYGGGGIYNYLTLYTSDNEFSEFLFHHEFGHGFASLADEYYSSLVPYNANSDLNYEPYQPNITTRIDFQGKWESMIPDTVPIPTPNLKTYAGVVGLFEGARYTDKGVFRPYLDCSMKSKINNAFCPVCKRAIEQMIKFYASE